jgi:hypothetical protein
MCWVCEVPKKRSQESSKSKKSRKQEEPKTCLDLKPPKKSGYVLLDLEGFKTYGYIFPYFFAYVATKYYLNKPLEAVDPDDLQAILDKFCNYVKDREDYNKPPFMVQQTDTIFGNLCLTPKALCEVVREAIKERRVEPIRVYGTILPETGEYLKLMFPKLEEYVRRENLAITTDLLTLAVIGAHISAVTVEGVKDERHYVFVDLIQEFRVDLKSLNGRARSLMSKLIEGNSSEVAIRVGIASIVADEALRYLSDGSRAVLYHVIVAGSTRERKRKTTKEKKEKIMLKSFNQYDVTNLALDIAELNIGGPLAKLIKLYPSRDSQDSYSEARKLRRLIEATCKAIYTWHATRRFVGMRGESLEELYSVLRTLSIVAHDHEELRKLDEFVSKHISKHIEESITLSDILEELSERMRIPL